MRRSTNRVSAVAAFVAAMTFAGCGGGDLPTAVTPEEPTGPPVDPPIEPPIPNPNVAAINSFIAALPGWVDPAGPPQVESDTPADTSFLLQDGLDYRCTTQLRKRGSRLGEIRGASSVFKGIYPGAIIPSSSLKGDPVNGPNLRVSSLPRASMTLATSAPIPNQAIEVSNPSQTTVDQAVIDLKTRTDASTVALPAIMDFRLEEVDSYEQTVFGWNISAGYSQSSDLAKVGVSAQYGETTTKSTRQHTISAMFVQELFTIRLAHDLIASPADYFADGITRAAIEAEFNHADLPMYVSSVTYGKALYFTSKSDEFKDAKEHIFSLKASVGKEVDGTGYDAEAGIGITAEQETKLRNASVGVHIIGGKESAGNNVVTNLDWREFFEETPASTALPLYFTVSSLKDNSFVGIVDNVDYKERDGCDPPVAYEVEVKLTEAFLTGGYCVPWTCAVIGRLQPPVGTLATLGSAFVNGNPGEAEAASPFGGFRTVPVQPGQSFFIRSEGNGGVIDTYFRWGEMDQLALDAQTRVNVDTNNFVTIRFGWDLTKRARY